MTASGTGPLLSFRLGPSRAALPLAVVREVLEDPPLVRVPGSLAHVAGVMLSHGVAVPVYDLLCFGPLWSEPREAAGDRGDRWSHVIVCSVGEVVVGLLGEQADLLGASAEPGPAQAEGSIRAEYLSGIRRSGADSVALLDPERLFPSLGVPAEGRRSAGEGGGEEDPAGR